MNTDEGDRLRAEVADLHAEVERRCEDIAWLFAHARGEPPLAPGETAHDWSSSAEGYSNRYINDYGSRDEYGIPDTHKLRRPRCANCGQYWTHY